MAETTRVAVSIIIPSHNRRALLRRVLEALATQDPETPPFEVIVVADGCRDGTEAMVLGHDAPFPIRLAVCPGVGPSAARNSGVERASSDLFLFLDDDVIPTRGLVAAHVAAHRDDPGRAVLGPYPPEPVASPDSFRQNVQRWWTAHFDELARPGHRFSYFDLMTGNLSLSRAIWNEIGGLDPQFARAREDLELGVRLMKRGIRFHYAGKALGWHQEHLTSSPKSVLHRSMEEGRSDVLMALKHPDMAPVLRVCWNVRRKGRRPALKFAVLRRTGFIDGAAIAIGQRLIRLIERLGLPSLREAVERPLRKYCYFRGAADALGGGWDDFAATPMPPKSSPDSEIDLAGGIDAAERTLTDLRPASVRILFDGEEMCILPSSPATEPWSGHHLRSALVRYGAWPFARILAKHRYGDAAAPSQAATRMIGVNDFPAQLDEARRQWERGHG